MTISRVYLLLLIIFASTVSGTPTQQQPSTNFLQINHMPLVPVVNSNVTFHVVMANGSLVDLVNLTLVVTTLTTYRYLMVQDDNQFFRDVFFSEIGAVSYKVEFYTSNGLEEISDVFNFDIVGDKGGGTTQLNFHSNFSGQLQAGNVDVASEDGRFRLALQLNESLSLQIQRKEQPTIPGRVILSSSYQIRVNHTASISQANLAMIYNKTLVNELGIDLDLISFSSRNETSLIWREESAEINTINSTATINPTHFSEWVVTAATPQVRFVSTSYEITTKVGEYQSIHTHLKNFGSFPSSNLSIRLIAPSTVLLNNYSTDVMIDQIEPLEEIDLSWEVYFTIAGNYTLILIAHGEGVDGDIIQVTIQVLADEITSQNSVNFYLYYTIVILVAMPMLLRKRR